MGFFVAGAARAVRLIGFFVTAGAARLVVLFVVGFFAGEPVGLALRAVRLVRVVLEVLFAVAFFPVDVVVFFLATFAPPIDIADSL